MIAQGNQVRHDSFWGWRKDLMQRIMLFICIVFISYGMSQAV